MNIRLATRELETRFGNYTEILFYDAQKESVAIVMGDVAGAEDVLCRIHSSCITAHVFNSIECDLSRADENVTGDDRASGKRHHHLA